ncbi:hypothetical protein DDE82_007574 [Stemphylium lycopersici]|uniref:Uncharacterized protein n=1 Tax=Stemphylium lycopersici TaxID=183478 RepID=A0A364NDD7_STELY|nr:hypothetical protein TW65_07474 [Stemphylium lycopersici]RAR00121.1 hypothetical protein DDE82_007574 [Stemphylium lycopersici]RAR15325.1 hypothetical protein DDE83_001359 [Stemphylium lycopersici]
MPAAATLYPFQSPKQKTTPSHASPSSRDITMVESEDTTLCSVLPTSTPTNPLTPRTNARPETPTHNYKRADPTSVTPLKKRVDVIVHSTTKLGDDTTSMSVFEKQVAPSPLLHKLSRNFVVKSPSTRNDAASDALNATAASMRAAEKLLHQRHVVIESRANTRRRLKPRETSTRKEDPKSGLEKSRLPSNISLLTQRMNEPRAASPSNNGPQRRQAIKDLVYHAADGCPTNIAIIEKINAHFDSRARHTASDVPDAEFNVHGVNVRASQMPHGSVERTWITRYNALVNNAKLVERRLMNVEDHEVIVTQLFPEERSHILRPEYFEIFVSGLGEEGILTKAQAKYIANAVVTTEEFDRGAHYTGTSVDKHAYLRTPTAVSMFDIPKLAGRRVASSSTFPQGSGSRHDLHYYLRILIEAAVYDQKFWKGYFFPNAREKVNSFYQAHKLSQEGLLLPPSLTDYSRDWTHREVRLLQRGHLVCELLKQYEANELTDFGIVRAVRATYVGIPAQPSWCAEDLESFLYHRISGSGLAVATVPEILSLHPENDTSFANRILRRYIMQELQGRAEQFEKEEHARLREIDKSYVTFKQARRNSMTKWERMKSRWKKMFGKKETILPFDPFAPDHGAMI